MQSLHEHDPDVVIVDYDDQDLNREAFLTRLIKTEHQVRVVLLSLQEGEKGSEAVVYDRRNVEASRIEEWLDQGIFTAKDFPAE
jgi:chemotaxis response regulator CheB